MTGTEDPSTSAMISRMLVARPPGVFRRRITTSTRRSPAVVSASFRYLAVAGPIAPSISIISAGLPLSSADRSAGEANWTAVRAKDINAKAYRAHTAAGAIYLSVPCML
jgi:hypothetical protein